MVGLVVVVSACSPHSESSTGVTAANHSWFPVSAGSAHEFRRTIVTGTIDCESCHVAQAQTFADFTCISCHEHESNITQRLHLTVSGYAYQAQSCLACHSKGEKVAFGHGGITGACAQCHARGAPFDALPANHMAITADCGGCHSTPNWTTATGAPTSSFDPAKDLTVTALVPSYAGTSIVKVTPLPQTLHMVMNHASTQVPADTMGTCVLCHGDAPLGGYFPGNLHDSLSINGLPQPTGCSSCHSTSIPTGFVGSMATNPARMPPSGEMKHDAVAWDGGAPTTTALVTQDCIACHVAPTDTAPTTWATGTAGAGAASYHTALTATGRPQPSSCIDCHANSRPTALLTSGTSSLALGLELDHSMPEAMGECAGCHSSGGATRWSSWSQGIFHQVGSTTPKTCLPCHEGERPTSTASWKSQSYQVSPFDYVGSADGGVQHGNNEDCVVCHAGPGTGGSWGSSTQSWLGGTYTHGSTASSKNTCLPCHTTQRPALPTYPPTLLPNSFDHTITGDGDCYGCHQATVKAGRYVDFLNPATMQLPGGDWKGGKAYPGDVLVASPGNFVNVTEIALLRGQSRFITGMISSSATLNNAMLHTSAALPAAMNPGPADTPDSSTCWYCHTNTNRTVTNYTRGLLHVALTDAGFPQPTGCVDCHEQMRPANIVEKAAASLVPMDHDAGFIGSVSIGGTSVSSVGAIECKECHATPGGTWSDGKFHEKIGAGVPSECAACHYPLMADSAKADVASSPATRYVMKHRSSRVTIQACDTCHTEALSKSTAGLTVAQWQTGTLHPTVPTQPTACNDCHTVTTPAGTTQSTTIYLMAQGATSSNGAQRMSHAASTVMGKDCVVCHAADAKTTGSAWSRDISFHANTTAGVTTCNPCHGGGTPGTNNNMPAGLTDSRTMTTSSASPANTPDQLTHADTNVARFECNFCHTQVGVSTAPGVQGKEWAQASFHKNFTASSPLVIVLTGTATGRCSNCHMNVKPGTNSTVQDHSAYTTTSAQDCSACHAWPGTSTTTPNWKGATGAHASSGSTASSTLDCNTCHGQMGNSSAHLSVPASTHFGGVTNGNSCISCHVNFAGFKGTTTNLLYKHTNAMANASGCVTCHAFVSQAYTTLTTTPSLTRPVSAGGHTFSQTLNVTGAFDDESFTAAHTATKMTACGACHQYATTTATTNIWAFKHRPSNPGISNGENSSGCNSCH